MFKSSVDRYDGRAIHGAARGRKRRLYGRLAYLLGVVCLVGYVIAFPPWVGVSYSPAYDQPGMYDPNGVFGIRSTELISPIWSPPYTSGLSLDPGVRWPWQAVSARQHVELSPSGIAWRIAKWIFLLGLALKGWSAISARNGHDRFVESAWSVSLGIAISSLGLMVFGGFTAGYGLTDTIVVGGLSAGALLGLAYGALTFRAERARQSLFTVAQLVWFVLGLVGSLFIAIGIGSVANGFRGDPVGVSELGTSLYAGNQRLINIVTGVGVALTGFVVSRVLAWSRMPRGFVVGLFVGALLLGTMYAIWF